MNNTASVEKTRTASQPADMVVAFRRSLAMEKKNGPGKSSFVPSSYACQDAEARLMAAEYRRQTSLNSMAQAAGLVEAGNTALGV